jgi:hypothetical protein
MKRVAAVVLFAMLLIPGVALAGSSTDAALGLGAFAVFNQILSGTGIFGAFNPAPAVAAAPVVVQRPVYVQQPVVVVPPPAPVYVAPASPVYYAPPAPVYYAPRPVVVYPAPGYWMHRRHARFEHEWRHRD